MLQLVITLLLSKRSELLNHVRRNSVRCEGTGSLQMEEMNTVGADC